MPSGRHVGGLIMAHVRVFSIHSEAAAMDPFLQDDQRWNRQATL